MYVPNGREVDHPHYAYKLQWFEALKAAVAGDAAGSRPFAVLGDYNVAPTDDDVCDAAAFEGLTHVTPAERAALAALREAGLSDVVPRPLKYDHPFTYWDYRQLGFPKNRGMRIDLVYGNEPFAKAVTDAYVDREERKGKGASDHAPGRGRPGRVVARQASRRPGAGRRPQADRPDGRSPAVSRHQLPQIHRLRHRRKPRIAGMQMVPAVVRGQHPRRMRRVAQHRVEVEHAVEHRRRSGSTRSPRSAPRRRQPCTAPRPRRAGSSRPASAGPARARGPRSPAAPR